MRLDKEKFQRARNFLKNNAREVDKALFEYIFEGGAPEAVIKALGAYQNEDGGFGKGIEPDFQMENSSPMATTIAFQYLTKIQADPEEEMVQKGIAYFLETYEEEIQGWKDVSKEVNDFPHAPWWHYDDAKGHTGSQPSWINPSAEIIAYLHAYPTLVPATFLQKLTRIAMEKLREREENLEMHEMMCYVRLGKYIPLPEKEVILKKLQESATKVIQKDFESWDAYSAKPLMYVEGPHSLLAPYLEESIQLNLDYEIIKQQEGGYWEPNWTWGQFETAWIVAKEQWKGRLTVDNLIKLKAFGRLELK